MDDQNQQAQSTSTNDVNNADTQTASDSSSAAQQTSDAGTQDNSTQTTENSQTNASETMADGSTKDKSIPFARLEQEIAKRAQLEERLRMLQTQSQTATTTQQKQQLAPEVAAAREQLKGLLRDLAPELGFVSKQEIQQQNAFNEVKTEHSRLATKYSGKDGLPKYDEAAVTDYAINILGASSAKSLEVAYKSMHEAEIMNARIQQGIQKTRGVQSERSNGTGSANTGVSNDDLMKAAQGGDKQAINLLIKRRLAKS